MVREGRARSGVVRTETQSCVAPGPPASSGRSRPSRGVFLVRRVQCDSPDVVDVRPTPALRMPDLSRASLVPRTQIAEDLLCGFGELGLGGEAVAVDVDGDLLKWSEFADESLDAHPGGLLQVAGDGQGGHHDGQVGLDRVAGAVEDRAGSQVVLGSCGTTAPRATARGRRRSPRRPP